MKLSASCLPGMEELLKEELQQIGAKDIQAGRQAVNFSGDEALLIRALNQLRSALRVFHVISRLPAERESGLYSALKKLPWKRYLGLNQSFAVQALESGGKAPASLRYITLKTKDIIVDSLRTKEGRRPSVDRNSPDISFTVLFQKDGALLLRDAAGTPLSQRGYRKDHAGAPLNEALAWGILRLAGFDPIKGPGILIDPMCGSGTFSIEAARYLKDRGIPPAALAATEGARTAGMKPDNSAENPKNTADEQMKTAETQTKSVETQHKSTGAILKKKNILVKKKESSAGRELMCHRWPDLGDYLIAASRSYSHSFHSAAGASVKTQTSHGGTPESSGETPAPPGEGKAWRLIASDLDAQAQEIAKRNARRAGVEEYIEFLQCDFHRLHEVLKLPASENLQRMMVLNPPYDIRLQVDDIRKFYSSLGDTMKQHWKGFGVHIFSANREGLKHVGLRPDTKKNLKNGQLNAGLYSYTLY